MLYTNKAQTTSNESDMMNNETSVDISGKWIGFVSFNLITVNTITILFRLLMRVKAFVGKMIPYLFQNLGLNDTSFVSYVGESYK